MMNDSTPRILIVNVHSKVNIGDQAIVMGQLQLLKKMFPAARLTITSRTPELDRSLWATWGVTVIAPIFHAPSGFRGKWRVWGKVLLSLLFPRQAWIFLRCLRQSDLVMACGGGYFYSTRRIPGLTFWQNYIHIRLAIFFKKEIIFFPQSYGPLNNLLSRRLVARLLASDHVRVAFAREAISLAVLSNLLPEAADKKKLQFCPDMAFYFSLQNEPSFPTVDLGAMPRPCLVLALRDWGFPNRKTSAAKKLDRENYLQGVIATCLDLHKKYNASFLIFNQVQGPSLDEDDRLVSDYVHHYLRSAIPSTHLRSVEPVMCVSPSMIIHMLRQADMVVTSRMHSAIFSFLAGTPVVVIGYQHKSLGILQSLKLEDCLLPIEQTRKETLLPLCEKVLENRDEWMERINRVIPGIRETIEEKFRMFFYGAD